MVALVAGMVLGAIASAAGEPLSNQALITAANDFKSYCTPCHGSSATGDGPLAADLSTPLVDLTQISARAGGTFPADAVYDKIEGLSMPNAHGNREMPVWGNVFVMQAVGKSTSLADAKTAADLAERRIRALVGYLETLQKAQ